MLRNLCTQYTDLSDSDIDILEKVSSFLPMIADLVNANVFIDCLTRDPNVAVVVAEAVPEAYKSIYKNGVVGNLALRENEPAALRTLEIGVKTRDLKAITQENAMVRQNAVPVKNAENKVIGVLIAEEDATRECEHIARMEMLSETTQQLTQTLMDFEDSANEDLITYHLNDAIIMFDSSGRNTYANPAAKELYKKLGYKDSIVGMDFQNLVLDGTVFDSIMNQQKYLISDICVSKLSLQVKYAAMKSRDGKMGLIMLIKDVTEVKEKEKEIILKSVAIREIHHRVKNNLQTIASLLRLQSRRIENEQIKGYFNESINRIMSMAITHEMLAQNGVDDIDVSTIISKIADNTLKYCSSDTKNICIQVRGDSFELNSDKAAFIGLVVNELIQNSIGHAFGSIGEGENGKIDIIIQKGVMYSSISIIDNGGGFDPDSVKNESLGLSIVKSIIKDKLEGNLNIESGPGGTNVTFDFKNA